MAQQLSFWCHNRDYRWGVSRVLVLEIDWGLGRGSAGWLETAVGAREKDQVVLREEMLLCAFTSSYTLG